MENQGKRLLLAVALALGVMLVWNMVFTPKKDTAPRPSATAGSGAFVAPSSNVGGAAPTPAHADSTQPLAPEQPRAAEEMTTLSFPKKFDVTFSSWTGGPVSWKLADARYRKDQTNGELLPHPVDAKGKVTGASPLPDTGTFQTNFTNTSTYSLPRNTTWKVTKVSETEVLATTSTPNLEVAKRFTLLPDTFLVRMNVTVKVKVPAGQVAEEQLALSVFAFQDPAHIIGGASQQMPRAWMSSTYADGKIRHTPISSLLKAPRQELKISWTGFEHPYLLAAYAPKPDAMKPIEKRSFAVTAEGLMRTDLLFPKQTFKSDAPPITEEVIAYLGPKSYHALEAADAAAGYPTGFTRTIDLGWFSFIGKPLLWLLNQFYSFLGNWGLAIILLTFLVKGATIYWTTKSMRSMKAMAALAPQMKHLQAKYKGDNQRLQAESMALYKTHGVSPIAGCLPIFLQMPIWLALYRMLSTAGELYQQPFIPGWLDDLTYKDPYHILPFILLATMFGQARLTPATGDSTQQKMMQYGMPLMFGVMAFFFPAGLTLYIFTNTVLSALHSLYMNRFDKKSLAMVAKIKASVDASVAKDAAPDKGDKGDKKTRTAKPVIDVESSEQSDDDEDESDSASATAEASGPARPRNKRKKRRR